MPRRPSIELYCKSEDQKRCIQDKAKERGLSVSEYLIGLSEHDGRDVGARRRNEGALTNAQLYAQLGRLVDAMETKQDFDPLLIQEAIALVQEVRREITLKRLTNLVEGF